MVIPPAKFGSPPSGNFCGINCRTFQSNPGLLHNSSKSSSTIPIINRVFSSFSPKAPSSSVKDNPKSSKIIAKCSSIPIPLITEFENEDRSVRDQLRFSELWAGPTYSNSPPPSSLPMPKFSLRSKRTVSLGLHTSSSKGDFHPVARSAPASPTRVQCPYSSNLFDISDSATKTLRLILNLDIADE